jgi:hypothetical protein
MDYDQRQKNRVEKFLNDAFKDAELLNPSHKVFTLPALSEKHLAHKFTGYATYSQELKKQREAKHD